MKRVLVSTSKGTSRLEGGVLANLYVIETLCCVSLFALYRLSAKAVGILPSIFTPWGIVLVSSVCVIILLTWFTASTCYRQQQVGSRDWVFSIIINIVVVSLAVVTGEVLLRFLATQSVYEEKLGAMKLLPLQWKRVKVAYEAAHAKAELQTPYLISDQELGWTNGQSRKNESGIYFSSVEGLRSHVQGVSMREKSASCRIALIGDSFTFGESVRFEDTWGNLLEDRLGNRCQILNFGVMGYGIDQVYLRYLKDVRPWHPDVVIFSFVNDDLRRTMHVYGFLVFPPGIVPFTKPRFILKGDELELLQLPQKSPWDTFSSSSIHDLPGINYDVGYRPLEWDRAGWEWIARSYILRYAISVHPLTGYDVERQEVSQREFSKLNGTLIASIRQAILADGAQPLIVFFPHEDFLITSRKYEEPGIQILKEQRLPYIDVQACMKDSDSVDLFMPDGHFSVKGNLRAAECLADDVNQAMQRVSSWYAAR